MPVCAGRADTGQCPKNVNDNSVTFSICDLFLCPECYDHRVPTLPTVAVSDNAVRNCQTLSTASVTEKKSLGLSDVSTQKLVINEVLFYAKGKFSSQTANNLKLVLSSFFTDEEVALAKELLHNAAVQGKVVGVPRYVKRQGGNRLKLNVDDLVKLLTIIDEQNLMNSLPRYVAADINRLPNVTIEDVDMFVLVKKLDAIETRLLNVEGQNTCHTSIPVSLQAGVIPVQQPGSHNVPPGSNSSGWPMLPSQCAVAVQQPAHQGAPVWLGRQPVLTSLVQQPADRDVLVGLVQPPGLTSSGQVSGPIQLPVRPGSMRQSASSGPAAVDGSVRQSAPSGPATVDGSVRQSAPSGSVPAAVDGSVWQSAPSGPAAVDGSVRHSAPLAMCQWPHLRAIHALPPSRLLGQVQAPIAPAQTHPQCR